MRLFTNKIMFFFVQFNKSAEFIPNVFQKFAKAPIDGCASLLHYHKFYFLKMFDSQLFLKYFGVLHVQPND